MSASGQKHPRVLVVGVRFEHGTGGGITLSNLFEGWPKDGIASVGLPVSCPSYDVCDRVYVLGTSEMVWVWPFSLVPRARTPRSRTGPSSATGAEMPPIDGDVEGGVRSIFQRGVDLLVARDLLRGMRLSDPLREWVRAFAPDVVYAQLSGLPVSELVTRILDETGAALALHFMDDWPNTVYREGMLAPLARRRMERNLAALISRADTLMAISEPMAAEYAARYGREFIAVHNPVDLQRWKASAAALPYEAGEGDASVRLVYAGRVGRANAGSLLDVAGAVAEMNSRGEGVRLHVFTPDDRLSESLALAASDGVTVHPAVEYERMPGLLEWADILLLPLDFSDDGRRFARLSMPTKLSEYLAAGRPVLAYSPRGFAVAEYARESGWGTLVDHRDRAAIQAALRSLLGSEETRKDMGARGQLVALERHDKTTVSARLADQLRKASLQHGERQMSFSRTSPPKEL